MSLHQEKELLPSLRSFCFTFTCVFSFLTFYFFRKNYDSLYVELSGTISIFFLVSGLFQWKALSPLNRAWFKFGYYLHLIINPIVMGLLYFVVITPFGLAMRLFGVKLLMLKYDSGKTSYWEERNLEEQKPDSMKYQF